MPSVSSYKIQVWGTRDGWRETKDRVVITLHDRNASIVGHIFFREKDADLPKTDRIERVQGRDHVQMHLPMSALGPVMDMLRYEKPLTIDLFEGHARLATETGAVEPIGEEERSVTRPGGTG